MTYYTFFLTRYSSAIPDQNVSSDILRYVFTKFLRAMKYRIVIRSSTIQSQIFKPNSTQENCVFIYQSHHYIRALLRYKNYTSRASDPLWPLGGINSTYSFIADTEVSSQSSLSLFLFRRLLPPLLLLLVLRRRQTNRVNSTCARPGAEYVVFEWR